jgi:hypothetical protein
VIQTFTQMFYVISYCYEVKVTDLIDYY